ncbi:multiple sugar transport system permease protein [Clavibacter michiganensis]|uniref:carbohydrate ABC transporter permease n=1 Tax=Clavibacter michiganensis TaxID=28447 RepID=UPI001DF9FAF3|nr:carbohydrate ABC transporter permease [Clavibacter michiganensis]MBP2457049.1 multiple sugar transport system permease protein [Clavibacter michiganensis]MDQ0409619.1 multiple sugar transport system permease protein [Clavibacter michiganensis]
MSTSAPARPASSVPAADASPPRAGRDRDARGLGAVRASMPRLAWYVACGCVALLFLYPLGIMLGTALTAQDGTFGLGNLQRLLTPTGGLDLVTSLRNSVVVSLLVTAITIVVSTLAGYAFARLPFRGSDVVFFVVLITFMIPFQAIITPLFLTLIELDLDNSLLGLSLVLATFNLPFGIFLMRNSFAAVPASLEEAALIDGNTPLQAMRRVMLPIAIPGIVSTALLTFFSAWNDFFATLILITDQSLYTLPVSLNILSAGQNNSVDWGLMQTGVAVTVLPCVVLYLLLQRYYVAGLISGAVK